MKLTNVLLKHHKLRWTRFQWRHKGWQYKRHSHALQALEDNNIPYENALEFVKDPVPEVVFNYDRVVNKPRLRKNRSHPDFKEEACHVFNDTNVLVEGLDQAKILTKSVEIKEGLPQQILKLKEQNKQSKETHDLVKKSLHTALVHDAYQEKLPIRKDPERPAYKFPRDYGIVDTRRNLLVCNKLLQLCEAINYMEVPQRTVIDNALFQLFIRKDSDLLQFRLRGDKVIMSENPLSNFSSSPEAASAIDLPDISPLKCTISIEKNNFYNIHDIHPVEKDVAFPHIHTALVHYNQTEVENAYALPVTDNQILSRSLMKAFTMAACQARYLYGPDVQDLPTPCTIQLIQTDAHFFHFSAFQLNTLNLAASHKTHNIFWSHPLVQICSNWGYDSARPFVSGYNPEVYDLFSAFYKNGSQKKVEEIKKAAQAAS